MTTKTPLVTVSAALAIGVLVANVANANVITLYGDYTNNSGYYDADVVRGSVECASCLGLLSTLDSGFYDSGVPGVSTADLTADGFSADSADLFYLAKNSEAAETAFVEAVVGSDLPDGVKSDGGGLSFSFSSVSKYILLKFGSDPNMVLLWNPNGDLLTYTYTGLDGSGAGLSHYTSVPEPETLALLLPGIAAMALGMRRRKVAVTA